MLHLHDCVTCPSKQQKIKSRKKTKGKKQMSNDYYPGEQIQEINAEPFTAQYRSNNLFATESTILWGQGTAVSCAALQADGSLS